MILDRRLSDAATRLFDVLALRAFGKIEVEISYSEVAEILGWSKDKSTRAMAELAKYGHILAKRVHNRPNVYLLQSSVFQVSRDRGTAVQPAREPLPHCAKCNRPCKRLTRAAYCRGCHAEIELARKVREATAELGHDASEKQIAAHIQLQRLTAKVRRAMAAA